MTTTQTVPDVVLRLVPDGTSTLTVGDAKPQPITAATVDAARDEALAHIRKLASTRARPIRFDAHDPDGRWQLLAQPDGQITEYRRPDQGADRLIRSRPRL